MLRTVLCLILALNLSANCRAAEPLVVHEWGTFTSLQDERGTALGRINTDDEPVPAFVHQMLNAKLFPPTLAFTSDAKGAPVGDPNVTMRLETPVLYFHPAAGQTGPLTLNVDVAFHGGWLTQYFPDALAGIQSSPAAPAPLNPISQSIQIPNANGEAKLVALAAPLQALSSKTVGTLAWQGITINSKQGKAPETEDKVWTSPRAVESAAVAAGDEREQFLFYRGVGRLDAPVNVVRNGENLEFSSVSDKLSIANLWLVDIRPDGALAFRAIPKIASDSAAVAPASFHPKEYSPDNFAPLRSALHKALVADGLFDDEADALLNTWERSYFRNPGERVFFLVPQSWTDAVLPISFSIPVKATRVMVGRIELVTPAQRALLQSISQAGPAGLKGVKEAAAAMAKLHDDPAKADIYNALAGGHGNLEDLGVPVPQAYADFIALGRFRSTLVLNSREGEMAAFGALITP